MASNFGQLEKGVQNLFLKNNIFQFQGKTYQIKVIGKPTPSNGHGEPKTDLFILAEDVSTDKSLELKLSIKKDDYEFLENRLDLARFTQIFNKSSISNIFNYFLAVEKNNPIAVYRSTSKSFIYKLGAMAFITNAPRTLSLKLNLSLAEKLEILCGKNLDSAKKNSKVNNQIYKDSGVANYILKLNEKDISKGLPYILKQLQNPRSFASTIDYYFALTRLNYRSDSDKWDGDRPLFICTNFNVINNQIISKYSTKMFVNGNKIGNAIKNKIKELEFKRINVSQNEFNSYFK